MQNHEQFEHDAMERLSKQQVVLDVGGGSRFMKGMKKYAPLFANCQYKTMDVSVDYAPDIVGDIHAIPLADASVDGVICRSVLEHVERPWDALREMRRILKPGGLLYVQVPSTYPYHARTGFGAYPDYWRFFESTLRLMLKDCASVEVVRHGGWFSAMAFFLPGQARLMPVLSPVAGFFDHLFHTERRTTTPILYCLAVK
ncbi:MAG: class I SAM-dependent methyltransferase [Patescibacteria group bacterium]